MSDMDGKKVDDLLAQLEQLCGDVITQISSDKCSLEETIKILGNLSEEGGKLENIVYALFEEDAFNNECQQIVTKTFSEVSKKLASFNNFDNALSALDKAKNYGESEEHTELIDELEGKIISQKNEYVEKKRKVEALIEQAKKLFAEKNYDSALIALEKAKEVGVSEYSQVIVELEKKIRNSIETPSSKLKYILIAAAVAVVVGAGFFMSKPKEKIEVAFILPPGATVVVDDQNIDNNKTKLSAGEHKISIQHPLLNIEYEPKLNIATAGKVDLIKKCTFREEKKGELTKKYIELFDELFTQARDNDNLNLDSKKYALTENGKANFEKYHSQIRKYIKDNQLTGLSVKNVDIEKIEAVKIDGRFYINVVAPLEYMVEGKGILKAKSMAQFEIVGNEMLPSSIYFR